jgi:hypothetical protein
VDLTRTVTVVPSARPRCLLASPVMEEVNVGPLPSRATLTTAMASLYWMEAMMPGGWLRVDKRLCGLRRIWKCHRCGRCPADVSHTSTRHRAFLFHEAWTTTACLMPTIQVAPVKRVSSARSVPSWALLSAAELATSVGDAGSRRCVVQRPKLARSLMLRLFRGCSGTATTNPLRARCAARVRFRNGELPVPPEMTTTGCVSSRSQSSTTGPSSKDPTHR